MPLVFTTNYIEDALGVFAQYKKLADGALAQVNDDDFFRVVSPESNSLAVIVKHLGGNLRSRWTDFPSSDGEKPWRNRDAEFEIQPGDTRASLAENWEAGWRALLDSLSSLNEADLVRPVTIRGERHSVLQAINRSLAHTVQHVGQIVFLAKQLTCTGWKTLSIPRGKSAEFAARVHAGQASRR